MFLRPAPHQGALDIRYGRPVRTIEEAGPKPLLVIHAKEHRAGGVAVHRLLPQSSHSVVVAPLVRKISVLL